MKSVKLALAATPLAAAFALAPVAAHAQDAGTTILSQEETPTEVGTVVSNDGSTVLVDTGTYQAPLPADYFAEREGNWTINATKDQINAMMAEMEAEAKAKLASALVVGAPVVSAEMAPAGTVLAIDEAADQIIVENEAGVVSLKREHFVVTESGALEALFTAEQLAGFTTPVPEGAEIRTASGTLVRSADGSEPDAKETASASPGAGASGVSD